MLMSVRKKRKPENVDEERKNERERPLEALSWTPPSYPPRAMVL
jgi:hypothetical protein